MFERFTKAARQVVVGSQQQAADLGHDHIGTEHLLLSLLAADSTDPAADALRECGVNEHSVRAEILRLTAGQASDGEADDEFDGEALRAIGIDPDAVRAKLEETFGADALDRLKSGGSGEATEWRRGRFIGGRHGLTKEAKKAIELSLREAVRLRSGEIDTPHVLLGLLREQRGLGVRILRENGVDLAELRQRALTSLGKAA